MSKTDTKKPSQKSDDVVILMLKLVSGENIIGKVVATDSNKIIIRDVVETKDVNYSNGNGIEAALYYSEWFPGAVSENYLINRDHIVCAAAPSPRVIRLYVENLVKQNLRKKREKIAQLLDAEDHD